MTKKYSNHDTVHLVDSLLMSNLLLTFFRREYASFLFITMYNMPSITNIAASYKLLELYVNLYLLLTLSIIRTWGIWRNN